MSESSFFNTHDSDIAPDAELSPLSPGEIVLGTLVGIDINGSAQVSYPQNAAAASVAAVSTQPITHQYVGRQVALLFAGGDLQKPIIMGFIHSPLYDLLQNFSFVTDEQSGVNEDQHVFDNPLPKPDLAQSLQSETIRVDGKKVVIEGQEEVVLTCGESSITLTKAGKIIIRGKYLLSRSTGVNRILGGSVQVN
jgi:hypothetical protein